MFKIIILLIHLLLFVCPVMAQDIDLSWDPSPSDDISGYKVYYSQKNISTLPLDGYESSDGDSPIDVQKELSTTVHGLANDGIYYFSVTAYDSDGNESTYSNIVSSGWIPTLYEPANLESQVTTPFVFSWESAPSDYDVSYILFYGTNKNSVTNAKVLPPINKTLPPAANGPFPVSVLILMTAAFLIIQLIDNRKIRMTCSIVFLGATLAACTGGSSSSGSNTTVDSSAAGTVSVPLTSVDMGTATTYQTTDLYSGTTYYWKVVAVDEVNTTLEYQSEVYSFTTAE